MTEAPGRSRKKELTRAWVERKRVQGVFAVRCVASDEVWVSSSRNMDTQKNSIWFALRMGGHPNRAVQLAWTTHGEASFSYEFLEEIADEGLTALGLTETLKSSERRWRETLGATALVG